MFKLVVGGFNPFEWEALKCPVCGGGNFISLDYAGVYCEQCNALFRTRYTGADPGVIVDCIIYGAGILNPKILAPVYRCKKCGIEEPLFHMWEELKCSYCGGDVEAVGRSEFVEKNKIESLFPEYFYLTLKIGEHCLGWIDPRKNLLKSLGFPTQEEWEKFQKEKGLI